MSARDEIQEMVDRETRAWDAKDVDRLLDLFHPDIVWPWPPTNEAHDPVEWVFVMGRFDRERWRGIWSELFATHDLVHNRRQTRRIEVTAQEDGAFAVVDVDTLWRRRGGGDSRWLGRACKMYTKVESEWKLIAHTGLLRYGPGSGRA